ncbi:hypothetical protein FAGAP_11471 [Fusarium agapanthi]|uniref:Uncharacterized protein n=1 Tax=Fusarium agapanthi TaxID=1803897 RepID=A0A9P5AZE4_9HYPO|nr:hypothetical protein FAGAP_11471 [Fusarium agapanthi]
MLMDNTDTVRNPLPNAIDPWLSPSDQQILQCRKYGKQYVIAAPNIENDSGGFVCKYNDDCKSKRARYWECNGRQDTDFKYCPPPGYPRKLHEDEVPLPQCLEELAFAKAREEKRRSMSRKAWKKYEKERKKEYKKLKKEYEERTKDEREQEKMEKKKMEEERKARKKGQKDS